MIGRRWVLPAAFALLCAGCGQSDRPGDLPDPGFYYLSRSDVAAAVATLAEPVTGAEPIARGEACACSLWNGRPELVFTSPVVPGAVIAAVGDSACGDAPVRRRGTPRYVALLGDGHGECVDLDRSRDSLIVVTDTAGREAAARAYLQAALLATLVRAPELLKELAVVTGPEDALAALGGRADTLAQAACGRLWVPAGSGDDLEGALSTAPGGAELPWIASDGRLTKLIVSTLHTSRDGESRVLTYTFVFVNGRLRQAGYQEAEPAPGM